MWRKTNLLEADIQRIDQWEDYRSNKGFDRSRREHYGEAQILDQLGSATLSKRKEAKNTEEINAV